MSKMYGLFLNTYDYHKWHDLICVSDDKEKLINHVVDNDVNLLEIDSCVQHIAEDTEQKHYVIDVIKVL